jgi:hypothetical protein
MKHEQGARNVRLAQRVGFALLVLMQAALGDGCEPARWRFTAQ